MSWSGKWTVSAGRWSNFIQSVILLDGYGVRFVACAGGIDTDKRNPSSKMLMHLLAMLAEFENDRIHELTGEGQKRYRELYARGKVGKDWDWQRQSRTGKNLPVGRPMKVFARSRAVEMRAQGMSWGKIAKEGRATPHWTVNRALAMAGRILSGPPRRSRHGVANGVVAACGCRRRHRVGEKPPRPRRTKQLRAAAEEFAHRVGPEKRAKG